ncbi:MAG: DEAD/DEAH box helicase [Spirochaetales bacterium]|nr:DEAD/DEAH box helicase [Spirochaetales bacterium]
MEDNFEALGLDPSLVKALETEKITRATDIQSRVISQMNNPGDLIFQSATGTGKTLAYLLPLFEKIRKSPNDTRAIILAPTHELVIQIQRQMERLAKNSGLTVTSTPLIGAANILRQIDKLKKKPHIMVGSPGRILELIKSNKIKSHSIKMIVLDEVDRLMDRHNEKTVIDIIKRLPNEKQVVIASASMPQNVIKRAGAMMSNPVQILSIEDQSIPESITHISLAVEQRDKIDLLKKLLKNIDPPKAIIFVNKVDMIENLTAKLKFHDIKTESIHGTIQKFDRKKVMADFQSGKLNVLIASDLAARGLQMDGITHVFNMDIPEQPNDYLHRAGRTGRNGLEGMVISLATDYDRPFLHDIENKLKIQIQKKRYFKGEITD